MSDEAATPKDAAKAAREQAKLEKARMKQHIECVNIVTEHYDRSMCCVAGCALLDSPLSGVQTITSGT